MSTIFRYSSGLPFYFRSELLQRARGSSAPGASRPSSSRASVFAQDKGSFDPGEGPLFNRAAFEPVDAFNFYFGQGNRIEETSAASGTTTRTCRSSRTRGWAAGRTCRSDSRSFNMWNWHIFSNPRRVGRTRRSTTTSRVRISGSGTDR